MAVEAKICGINSREGLDAAIAGGARWVGFVFYARSPRFVTPDQVAPLADAAPQGVGRVGLFVDVDDATFEMTLARVTLDMLQLHGGETPERVAAIRKRFGLPVIKAIKLAAPSDLTAADGYAPVADRLLFDAKTPPGMKGALPGGNAVSFDWSLLTGAKLPLPWMLSGGLTPENVAGAVRTSGARAVDVSSGVEDRPGHKDPARIARFLEAVKSL